MDHRENERKAAKVMGIGTIIFGFLFMIVWCALAISGGAWFMCLFAIPMFGVLGFRLYAILKAGKKDQKPREPWEQPPEAHTSYTTGASENGYCPYCGTTLQEGFSFCPKCGRRL